MTSPSRIVSRPRHTSICCVSPLAARHGLTVYDVLYLDLALRETASVATIDGILRRAADERGVLWRE